MIRFASSYLGVDKKAEAAQVLRATFLVRILLSFILFAIIFNTAELLSTKVFHDSGLTPLLKLTAFGVLSISIWFHLKSALYTYRLFQMSVIVQILIDSGKLLTVIVLIFYLKMNAVTAVAAFAFTPLIGVLLGLGQLYRKLFSKRGSLKNQISKLFSYSKWLFVSNICGLTLPYVGVFMLAKILGGESAGIYGLALRLVYIFPIINYSLQAVLLPEVSRFTEITQLEKYIKGTLKISFCIRVPRFYIEHQADNHTGNYAHNNVLQYHWCRFTPPYHFKKKHPKQDIERNEFKFTVSKKDGFQSIRILSVTVVPR